MEFLYVFHSFPLEFLCAQAHILPISGGKFFALSSSRSRSFPAAAFPFGFENLIRSIPMMDVVMVALAIGFFALSIAYVYACEQL